jgi:hypothetical protein
MASVQETNNRDRKPPRLPADLIRDLRIGLHRELDRLMDTATNPLFTGNVSITVCSKCGRLGVPKVSVDRFGLAE